MLSSRCISPSSSRPASSERRSCFIRPRVPKWVEILFFLHGIKYFPN